MLKYIRERGVDGKQTKAEGLAVQLQLSLNASEGLLHSVIIYTSYTGYNNAFPMPTSHDLPLQRHAILMYNRQPHKHNIPHTHFLMRNYLQFPIALTPPSPPLPMLFAGFEPSFSLHVQMTSHFEYHLGPVQLGSVHALS